MACVAAGSARGTTKDIRCSELRRVAADRDGYTDVLDAAGQGVHDKNTEGQTPSEPHKQTEKKAPEQEMLDGALAKILGDDLLSHMKICSIIGDRELNFRVRNGIGCTLPSMVTKKSLLICIIEREGRK